MAKKRVRVNPPGSAKAQLKGCTCKPVKIGTPQHLWSKLAEPNCQLHKRKEPPTLVHKSQDSPIFDMVTPMAPKKFFFTNGGISKVLTSEALQDYTLPKIPEGQPFPEIKAYWTTDSGEVFAETIEGNKES